MSFDVLQEKIIRMKNPTVVGLDPKPEYVPEHIRKASYEQFLFQQFLLLLSDDRIYPLLFLLQKQNVYLVKQGQFLLQPKLF